MKVKTESRSLSFLLESFYEDNPRQHSLDLDIKKLADRLLTLGWCEHVTLNDRNGKIVDGHGRVLAAEYLNRQSQEWFDTKWEESNTKGDRARYNPNYWLNIPVIISSLDEASHAAMTLGLNNEKAQGTDDPKKMQAIASSFSAEERELSGFSVKMKAIAAQLQSIDTEEEGDRVETEYEGKQYFEREDATDCSREEEKNGEPVAPVKHVLNLSVEWKDWKKWRDWKIANGYDNDTDAFWGGMATVFEEMA